MFNLLSPKKDNKDIDLIRAQFESDPGYFTADRCIDLLSTFESLMHYIESDNGIYLLNAWFSMHFKRFKQQSYYSDPVLLSILAKHENFWQIMECLLVYEIVEQKNMFAIWQQQMQEDDIDEFINKQQPWKIFMQQPCVVVDMLDHDEKAVLKVLARMLKSDYLNAHQLSQEDLTKISRVFLQQNSSNICVLARLYQKKIGDKVLRRLQKNLLDFFAQESNHQDIMHALVTSINLTEATEQYIDKLKNILISYPQMPRDFKLSPQTSGQLLKRINKKKKDEAIPKILLCLAKSQYIGTWLYAVSQHSIAVFNKIQIYGVFTQPYDTLESCTKDIAVEFWQKVNQILLSFPNYVSVWQKFVLAYVGQTCLLEYWFDTQPTFVSELMKHSTLFNCSTKQTSFESRVEEEQTIRDFMYHNLSRA
ncbi:hypothetical protein OAT84_00875 [Gammaproteobacteria bacterium]|nr:hypothetical protein [Gammaproteobacteria bacterium]